MERPITFTYLPGGQAAFPPPPNEVQGPTFLAGPAPLVWVPDRAPSLPHAQTKIDEEEELSRRQAEAAKWEAQRQETDKKNSKCGCRIKPFKALKRAFGL